MKINRYKSHFKDCLYPYKNPRRTLPIVKKTPFYYLSLNSLIAGYIKEPAAVDAFKLVIPIDMVFPKKKGLISKVFIIRP